MDKIGIEYDASQKYLGDRGQYIGCPQKPDVLLA